MTGAIWGNILYLAAICTTSSLFIYLFIHHIHANVSNYLQVEPVGHIICTLIVTRDLIHTKTRSVDVCHVLYCRINYCPFPCPPPLLWGWERGRRPGGPAARRRRLLRSDLKDSGIKPQRRICVTCYTPTLSKWYCANVVLLTYLLNVEILLFIRRWPSQQKRAHSDRTLCSTVTREPLATKLRARIPHASLSAIAFDHKFYWWYYTIVTTHAWSQSEELQQWHAPTKPEVRGPATIVAIPPVAIPPYGDSTCGGGGGCGSVADAP